MSSTDSQPGGGHKQILKSSLVMGGASFANIVIGLLRMKVVAVLLGPAGVGLIGLLNNLMTAGASFSAMGLGNSGTRQIAEANGKDGDEELFVARQALFGCSVLLALIGAAIFFSLRTELAKYLLDDESLSPAVGWLSIGLAVGVIAGSQKAFLTGVRRIADVARIAILTSFLSAIAGISALYLLGEDGVVLFVISAPVVSLVVSHYYVAKIRTPKLMAVSLFQLYRQWSALIRLGAAFMIASLSVLLGQLAVRSIVQHELGPESLGYFQAAWSISMTYISFVLAAMGTDYFPRLTGVIKDHEKARKTVNDQAEVAILLAGPVLIAMLAFTPWVLQVLYTKEFYLASNVLRWQILGDVLKILCWPMGFIIVASGKGKLFMLKEILVMGVFVTGVWLMIPHFGLEATGIAFVVMYLINIPIVLIISRVLIGFSWAPVVKKEGAILVLSALSIAALSHVSDLYAVVAGVLALIVISIRNLMKLSEMAELSGPFAKVLRRLRGRSGEVE